MDRIDVEDIFAYAKEIIDARPEYDCFRDSESLREESAQILTDYLLSMDKVITKFDKRFLKNLINRWIDNDLFRLRSMGMQDRSQRDIFGTRRKINAVNTKTASIALAVVLLGSAAFAIRGHTRAKNKTTVDEGITMGDKLRAWNDRYAASHKKDEADMRMEELLAELTANAPHDPYCKPKPWTGDAMMNYMAMGLKYSEYFREKGPEYVQIPIYDICFQIYTEYGSDQYRTMDSVFLDFQNDLKRSAKMNDIDRSKNAIDKYELIAGYRTYLEYVYNMLENAGYDVSEYKQLVDKYSSYDSVYPMENNGLSGDEVLRLNDMFALYREYIEDLRHERVDHK